MRVFADTSALYSFLDADDADHAAVVRAWDELAEASAALVTTNYVMVETLVLLQSRLGLAAVRDFTQAVAPAFEVEWVTRESHDLAIAAVLTANRRDLSVVDCVSFDTMRRRGLRHAFTLDAHFFEQGFERFPALV